MFTVAKARVGRPLACLVAALSLVMLAAPAHAVDRFWDVPFGDWNEALNWLPNGVPTTGDDAYIDNGGLAQVTTPGAVANDIVIGDDDAGTLQIFGGGTLSDRFALIGWQNSGTATVSGENSAWTSSEVLNVGVFGTGTLDITNGGAVSVSGFVFGVNPGISGTVTVDGAGSTLTDTCDLCISRAGNSGSGTLTIADDGTVNKPGGVVLGFGSGSTGTLNIGSGGGAGILNAPSVEGGAGTGNAVNFNHNEADYYFTRNGTAGGTPIQITGNTRVDHLGSGTTTLSAVNTYTGGTRVRNGTLHITGSVSHAGASTVVGSQPGDNGTLNITDGGTVESHDGFIGDSAGSTGTVTVSGANSNWTNSGNLNIGFVGTGTLTISGDGEVHAGGIQLAFSQTSTGTLNIGSGGAAGVLSTPTLFGLAGAATLNFNHTDSNYFFTNDGTSGGTPINITGSMAVHHLGSGTTTLNGNNDYAGGTTFDAGTLRVSSNTHLGDPTGTLTFDGGALSTTAGFTMNRPTTLNSGGGTFDVSTGNVTEQQGSISGAGGLTKLGDGRLLLSGANTFTGGTTIVAGTLQAGAANGFVAYSDYFLQGGTLDLNDFNLTMHRLSGLGGTVDLGAAALVVDQTSPSTFDGDIVGSGSLTKQGPGILKLTGTHTYTGGTTVREGTLEVPFTASINHPDALLVVGANAGDDATLRIAGGGHVTSFFGRVGADAGSTGHVEVSGAGSTWTNRDSTDTPNDLHLGLSGIGSLDVNSQGVVSSRDGTLGLNAGGNGSAVVSGGGSLWTLSRNLIVGGAGAGTLTLENGGRIDVATTFTLAGSATSSGTLNIGSGGAAGIVNSASVVGGVGTATLNFNHNDADYFFTDDGTAGGTPVLITGATAVNHLGSGTTTLTGNHTYSLATTVEAGTLIVNGSISNSGVVVNAGGTLGGSGSVGNLLVNGGTVAPGNSAGTLTAISYTQDPDATLAIDIGGTLPGSEFDVLDASGTATLDGLLNVSLINGFAPSVGQQFTVLTASSVADNSLTLAGSAADLFELIVDSTSVTLQAVATVLAGDYNGNGVVEAADYVLWRKNPGAFGGQQGYDTWRANFGNSSGGGSFLKTAVPEPASFVLLVLAVAAIHLRRQRSPQLHRRVKT